MEYYIDQDEIARSIAEHIKMGLEIRLAIILALISFPPWRDAIYKGIEWGTKDDKR